MAKENKLLSLQHLSKHYTFKREKIPVLKDINLEMDYGDFVVIKGKSGSGKTTLLNIISGLIKPSSGTVYLGNKRIHRFFDFYSSRFRSKHIGFVFQNFNLISYQTVLENVMGPLIFSSNMPLSHKKRAKEAIAEVGLSDRERYYPNLLSGGQMQRVAIARAMVKKPILIIADEPTGNLDFTTASEINEIFLKLNRENNISFIIVTHSKEIADTADRCYELRNGILERISASEQVQ